MSSDFKERLRRRAEEAKAQREEAEMKRRPVEVASASSEGHEIPGKQEVRTEDVAATLSSANGHDAPVALPIGTPLPGRGRAQEPGPALKAFIDLPIKFEVPDPHRGEVAQLAKVIASQEPDRSWEDIYKTALSICVAMEQEADSRFQAEQDSMLDVDDPGAAKQRLSATPRSDAEKTRSDARAELQTESREWTDRVRRQHDHVLKTCLQPLSEGLSSAETGTDSLCLEEIEGPYGQQMTFVQGQWDAYRTFVEDCRSEWLRNTSTAIHKELFRSVQMSTATLSQSTGTPIKRIHLSSPVFKDGVLGELATLPGKHFEVPGFWGAMIKFLRTNLMQALMLGAMIVGPASIAFGAKMERAHLALFFIPPALIYASFMAGRKQNEIRRQALRDAEKLLHDEVKRKLTELMADDRGRLERFNKGEARKLQGELDNYFSRVVEPVLCQGDREAEAAFKAAKINQRLRGEKLNALKSFCTQIHNLVVDLKKRVWDQQKTYSALTPVPGNLLPGEVGGGSSTCDRCDAGLEPNMQFCVECGEPASSALAPNQAVGPAPAGSAQVPHSSAAPVQAVPGNQSRPTAHESCPPSVLLIGREETCGYVLPDHMAGASRQHARLVIEDNRVYLEDLGSANGTFVNGQQINRVPVKPGDRVSFGRTSAEMDAADLLRRMGF